MGSFSNTFLFWLWRTFILSQFLLSAVQSSYLLNPKVCGKPECPSIRTTKFNFETGLKYVYKYNMTIDTAFDVARSYTSRLRITTKLSIEFITPCEATLKILNAEVIESSQTTTPDVGQASKLFYDALSANSLRFFFEDGTIREICPHINDTSWVINFKKGILSTLQNTMNRMDLDYYTRETDISGKCITEYKFEDLNSTTLIISKKKDIFSCINRAQLQSFIPTSSYIFENRNHKWTPLESTNICYQLIDHKIITKVVCEERHSFLPLYNQKNGATTDLKFQLELLEEKNSTHNEIEINQNQGDVFKRESLLYDHKRTPKTYDEELKENKNLIRTLCSYNSEEFKPDSAEVFNKFIHEARHLSYLSLSRLLNDSVSLCPAGKKYMVDALPHLRSSAAISVMSDVLLQNTLPVSTARQFLLSIALHSRPDDSTISAVAPLLLKKPIKAIESNIMLALSSLIHSFCKFSSHCENNEHVIKMIAYIENIIDNSCQLEELDKVMFALKAIGNGGILTSTLISKLQKCIQNPGLPLEIRVAAVEAHRRVQCDANRDFLLKIFVNQSISTELRIAAYLQVLKCPTYYVMTSIRQALEKEEVNQVLSFVWSHLQNVKQSSMPSRVEIQGMLYDQKLKTKFNNDFRKFSRNYEQSFFLNDYGVGGFVVYNVIFSQNSYIPSTVMANVTINIFGESINLAEVTLKFQGFEHFIEKLFWHGGILSRSKVEKIIRLLRSLPLTLRDQVDQIPNIFQKDFNYPKASMAVKLFGNEVKYSMISGNSDINDVIESLNPVTIIKRFLSGQELNVEKSLMFIDVRYIAPLSVGLPLIMDAVGTNTIKLNAAGFFNLTAFTNDALLDIDGKLKPSIAVNTVGIMAVDAFFAETSIKLHNKIFTSTAMGGRFRMKEFKYISLALNLPLKKSEIFSMKNELVVVNGKRDIILHGITPGKVEDQICSWPLLDDVLGLQLCTSYLLPNSTKLLESPLLIFTSPVNVRIFLEKSDPSTKRYTFEYKMLELENKTLMSVEFETPDSNIKRSLRANILLGTSAQNFTLVFQSASNQIKAEGFYVNNHKEKSLNFLLDINGKKHVDIQLAIFTKSGKHGYTFEPKMLLEINNKRIADLSGSYKWVIKNSISQCDINLSFRTNKFVTNIKGYARTNDASISANINTEYQFVNQSYSKPEYLKFEISLNDRSNNQIDRYHGKLLILSSAYPQINLITILQFQGTDGHVDCETALIFNPEFEDEKKKLKIEFNINFHKTLIGSKTDIVLKIVKPDNMVDIKFALGHYISHGVTESIAYIRYALDKEIKLSLNLTNPKGSLLFLEAVFQVELPGNLKPMVLMIHVYEKVVNEFDIDFMGTWFSGHTLSVKGLYQDRSAFAVTVHIIKLIASSQFFYDIILNGRLHISDEEYKIELQAEHNSLKYAVILYHITTPGVYLHTYGGVQYGHRSYSCSNYIDIVNQYIRIELHLDQHRDIHILLRGTHKKTETNAGFDISWDVNRDPSQRIVFNLESFLRGFLNYEGRFVIEYPGRVISASVEFSHRDTNYMGTALLDWSHREKINIVLFAVYDLTKNGMISFRSMVTTPFEKWKSSSFNYGLWLLQNGIQSNASIKWQDNQSVQLDVSYTYLMSEELLDFNFKTILNSTIKEINSMHTIFHHTFTGMNFDSGIIIQSAPTHVVSIQSAGNVLRDMNKVQYSAYIDVSLPYNNWTGGHLSCNASLDKHRTFTADLKLILNERQFSSSIKGTVKLLNESNVVVQFITPFEKYRKIIARFMFSSSKKHLIFDMKGPPTLELGIEILYMYKNKSDFNFLLHAMTGISFLKNVLIVAHRNDKLVDFRTGWNTVMVGVIGKSFYASWNNFEYKGILYTPFKGFKESGVTVKFANRNSIDIEARASVAQYKVGLKFLGIDWKRTDSSPLSYENTSTLLPLLVDINENTSYILKCLYELDTIIYHTMSGNVAIIGENNIYYTTGNFLFPYVQVDIQDELNVINIAQLSNHFSMKTNNSVLAELESTLELSGLRTSTLLIKLEAVALSYNQSLEFDMETAYIFKQIIHPNGAEGIYKVNHKLQTPFEYLDHFYLDFNLQNQNYAYATNLTVDIKDVRVIVDSSLDMSVDGNYVFTHTEMSIISSVFTLPVLKLSITKDFTEVENKLLASVDYIIGSDIGQSPIKHYLVGGTWQFGGEDLFKLNVYLSTPYPNLDELKASIHYSHEEKLYFLETFFKYTSEVEVMLRGNVDGSSLSLHIESPCENFRLIDVTGVIQKNEVGDFIIESVMKTDSVVTMKGKMATSYEVPLCLKIDLYKKYTDQHLVELSMDVRRKLWDNSKGYDLLLLVKYDRININFESDLTISSLENVCRLIVNSNHPDYNKVNLTLQLFPERNFESKMQLSGLTSLKFLTTEFHLSCSHWFKKNEGNFKIDLDSPQFKGNSYLAWTLDYLRKMQGFANATYSYENISKDFSSHLFLISPNANLDNIFIGADFNTFSKHWWFNTNVSLMAPTLNNIVFTSHLRLPHDTQEVHTLVGKLHYTQDMTYLSQLLKYSTVNSNTGFKTVADMKRTGVSIDGEIFVMIGANNSFFLHDILSAKKVNPTYNLTNVFKSSFIRQDITLKLLYEKPADNHVLKVDVFYPRLVTVVGGYVNFNSINNLYATINCTAPFSNIPNIVAEINAITNYWKYQRYGQMKWKSNTALFNYTHTKRIEFSRQQERHSNITDGFFIVDFPLATRHVGQVTYTYEDLENWSSGFSKMVYNEEEILQGNFTYRINVSGQSKIDDISINLNNSYIPIGLKYFCKSNKGHPQAAVSLIDIKRAEIFHLTNLTAFNLTGELTLHKATTEDHLLIKILHANANRSLTIDAIKFANTTFKSSTKLFLKSKMWFNSNLYITSKDNETTSGKSADLSLSYPRRDFFINGGYLSSDDQLVTDLFISPNNYYGYNRKVGAVVYWRRSDEDRDHQHTSFIISHPSFEKNLTLIGDIKFNKWALLNVNSSLEYSTDQKKKVSFNSWFENKKTQFGREYVLNIFASHPTSRLNLDLISNLKIGQAVFDFRKNITYRRSYLPLQFWVSKLKLDGLNQSCGMESHSLRELISMNANYAKEGLLYKLNGSAVKGSAEKITGHFYINLEDLDSRLIVNLTPDASEQLHMRSRYLDNRHAFFNVWRMYRELSVPDFTFDIKLNHSQLLFGTLSWRPEIKNEIVENVQASSKSVWKYIVEAAEFWTEYGKSEAIDAIKDIWIDAKPVLQDFLDDLRNVDMLKEDIEYFRQIFNESYNANEFYMQDVYNVYLLLAEEIAFKDKMGSLPKIVNELWHIMGETGETIRQSILWITETINRVYIRFIDFFSSFESGKTTQQLSQSVSNIFEKYDKLIKDLHVYFIHYIESLWDQAADFFSKNWIKCMQIIEPTVIEILHYLDTVITTGSKNLFGFLYEKPNQFLNSPFFSKESVIGQDLDKFYKDITRHDFISNIRKYVSIIIGALKEKYFAVVPFGYELTAVASEIYNEIEVLYKLPAISFVIDTSHKIYLKIIWVVDYFEIGNKVQRAIPVVYHQITELSHTALENEMKNRVAKTKFIFNPKKGFVRWEQKLPVPWHSFNETPSLMEIPEYRMVSKIESWMTPSNTSFLNIYYRYGHLLELSNWLPPFKGQAIIIKGKHFITFDKKYYSYSGPCSYLLAKDFLNNDFALVLKADSRRIGHHTIALFIRENIIEIDLVDDIIKSPDRIMNLPLNVNGTYVLMENNIVTVTMEEMFTLKCNLKYDVCTFDISGWYFGKTAGLLGTMDNEPNNDIMSSTGYLEPDRNKFMKSWSLDEYHCQLSVTDVGIYSDSSYYEQCNSLFVSKTSQFSVCFPAIDPLPFKELCQMSTHGNNEICTSAISYVQACLTQDIPLRIPYSCVKCQLENGTQFMEGNFVEVTSKSGLYSADVVFIVDAKECTLRLLLKKHVHTFTTILNKELEEKQVKNNRFSVVVFGGDGVYNKPNNILINNEVFTSSKMITDVFKNIPTGNGDADIFGALKYATKMQFRIGASKIFILISCTTCDIKNMTLDYSVLNDVLRERGITLHILMNNDFGIRKPRLNKIFYGLDTEAAYTKNDFKVFKGDRDLLRQVRITKSLFGHCTPLALETNGTLFSAKRLENATVNAVKKFFNVFSKRIAKTAIPPSCQMCECSADDNGIDFIECFPCDTPLPSVIDFGRDPIIHTVLQSVEDIDIGMDSF